MPFLRPSLTSLQNQALMDYTSSGFAGQLLAKSVLRVIALAQAGLAYLQYSYMDWISKQSVPFTADGEYLESWSGLKNVIRQSATAATGAITVIGTSSSVLPGGSVVQTSDSTQYTVDSDVTISGSSGAGTITAVVPGLGGNAGSGIPLTSINSYAGITAIATTSALTGGNNMEDDNSLRSRMLQAFQSPPQGGATSDYVTWALAVPGVTRAWCNPNGGGVGSVVVYVMFDMNEAAYNGFPQGSNGGAFAESRTTPATGDQLSVANSIYPLRPVTALVYVYAPTPYPVNITISNLNPGGSLILAGITTALTDMFEQVGAPFTIVGSVTSPSVVYQSDITGAIESVSGVNDFVVTIPATSTSIPIGSLPTLGTVTYV